jgi:hypothetical protein
MTCKVERYGETGTLHGKLPGELKSMKFHCDADGCDVVAEDEEIERQGGLRFMGWWAAGGKHYCPKHFSQGGKTQW